MSMCIFVPPGISPLQSLPMSSSVASPHPPGVQAVPTTNLNHPCFMSNHLNILNEEPIHYIDHMKTTRVSSPSHPLQSQLQQPQSQPSLPQPSPLPQQPEQPEQQQLQTQGKPPVEGFTKNGSIRKIRSASRKQFTHTEDLRLTKLVKRLGENNWDVISGYMTNRSRRQCKERYDNYLSPEVNNKNSWTVEDDELLLKKYEDFGPKWQLIATYFTKRSKVSVKNRYKILMNEANNRRATANCGMKTRHSSSGIYAECDDSDSNSGKKNYFQDHLDVQRIGSNRQLMIKEIEGIKEENIHHKKNIILLPCPISTSLK